MDELRELVERVINGEEPSARLAVRVFKDAPLHELLSAADRLRSLAVGERGSYVVNVYVAYTNVCVARCPICNFYARSPEEEYVLQPEQVASLVVKFWREKGVREAHVTGGFNPALRLDYYKRLVASIKRATRGNVLVKAFTAEEIDFLSRLEGESVERILLELRESGLDALPGGGAEVLTHRVRRIISPNKTPPERYLEIHKVAHKLGIRSNVTLLYGHIEEPEDIVEHLLAVRRLQAETRGFISIIPLRWNPRGTSLYESGLYRDAIESKNNPFYDLRVLALTRILLYPLVKHVVAYWVAIGLDIASIALRSGADDLGGTFYGEPVITAAREGRGRQSRGIEPEELEYVIAQAGLEPCERDTFYNCLGIRSASNSYWRRVPWVAWRPSM